MRALVPDHDGGVRFDDVPEPTPAADEALVEVAAFSVNRGETLRLARPLDGWRPGKDIAGTVVRAAADGSGPVVGARVVAHPPAAGWAERVSVPTSLIAELPNDVDLRTAAVLPLAGITALGLLRVVGSLSGKRLLITGASGGVGHYLTELAVAQGAVVTAVSTRGERLRSLGATTVSAVEDVRGRFDVVLESVGGSAFLGALRVVADGGTLVWFGQASKEAVALDFLDFDLWPADVTIRRFTYEPGDRPHGADLATLVRLVERGSLHPEIGVEVDWARIGDVLADLRDRKITGNAVLTVRPLPPLADARTVVTSYVRALQDHDISAAAAHFHPDAVWHIPGDGPLAGDYVGPDAIFGDFYDKAVARFDQTAPGRLELRSVVADGEVAVAEWRTTGRSVTGAEYDNSYCVVFTVLDGRIADAREYLDTAHFAGALFGVHQ